MMLNGEVLRYAAIPGHPSILKLLDVDVFGRRGGSTCRSGEQMVVEMEIDIRIKFLRQIEDMPNVCAGVRIAVRPRLCLRNY